MRTIAIINQKGGCGKTTTAINLASVLALKGRRTLLVDMDPQAHCSLGLAVPEAQVDRSVTDMLRAGLDGSIAFSDITWQISRNLDLAPCTMALATLEAELTMVPDKDRRLAQVLSTVSDQYDFCIIDCPPSIGLLTFNALRASREVIIPVETGYFSMQGSIKQEATIQMLARRANHLARFKVLATMYDVRTKLAREILAELRRHFGDKLLPMVINFNSKLKEAASFGQAITEYDPASRGMADFEKLVAWLLANPPAEVSVPGEPQPAAQQQPAMNRAAELVERARALSRRTAALSARLDTEPIPSRGEPMMPAPAAPVPPRPAPEAVPAAVAAAACEASRHASTDAHRALSAAAMVTSTTRSAPVAPQTAAALAGAGPRQSILVEEPPARPTAQTSRLEKVYGVRRTREGLLFVQPANGRSREIAVAGDFNGWQPQRAVLRRDETLGVFQALVPVKPGRYRYRLVVDGKWTNDPYNTVVESNPYGELDSIVEVGSET